MMETWISNHGARRSIWHRCCLTRAHEENESFSARRPLAHTHRRVPVLLRLLDVLAAPRRTRQPHRGGTETDFGAKRFSHRRTAARRRVAAAAERSEERRVGKECRSRMS